MYANYYSDIQSAFRNHQRTLEDKKFEAEQRINNWKREIYKQIDEHVKIQMDCLYIYYKEQTNTLTTHMDKLIDIAREHYLKYESKPLDELINRCRNLKYELLVEFDEEKRPIPFILCMTKDQLEQKRKFELHADKTGNNGFSSQSSFIYDKDVNRKSDQKDFSDGYIFTSEQQTNRQSSLSKTETTHDRSIDGNIGVNVNIGLEEKCPVCFMIFPPTMNMHDRGDHTQAHFK